MLVTVRPGADPEKVRRGLVGRGLWVTPLGQAPDQVHFFVRPFSGVVNRAELAALDGVASVAEAVSPHPLVDAQPRVIQVGDVTIGAGAAPTIMAGPCSVESPEQIRAIAAALARLGVRVLRGGAFKPRTSPYDFQGRGEVALGWLREAARAHGMLVVSEALGESSVEAVAATRPAWRLPGWTPMSAKRFTVACCMRGSGAALPRSWFESNPQVHWIVPAPNTRAPLLCR